VHDGIMVLSYAFLAATHLGYCTCTVMNTSDWMLSTIDLDAALQGAQNMAVLKDIIAPAWAGALSSLIHTRSTTQAAVVNRQLCGQLKCSQFCHYTKWR